MNTYDGRIIKGIGGFYYVDTAQGVVSCKARGKFRINEGKPMIGDQVSIDLLEDETGFVMELYPRKNQLLRPAVSNVDQVVVVISQAPPRTDLFMVDKIIAIGTHKEMDIIVCINKCDLDKAEEQEKIYKNAGLRVVQVSAETGNGVKELQEVLQNKVSVLVGNSGVGKSSLINQLCEEFALEVGEISKKTKRGKHTTRHVELLKISEDTFVVDTPGFSSLEIDRMDAIKKEDLQFAFCEMADLWEKCRFTGCSHIKEKDCAVRAAVEAGSISSSRYESYIKLYESMKKIKEWE